MSVLDQVNEISIQQAADDRKKLGPLIKTIILSRRLCKPLRDHRDFGRVFSG